MSAGVFAIHAKPGRNATLVLSWLLFVAGVCLYFYTSAARHRENPEDRVTPTIAQMVSGMRDAVLRPAEDDDPLPEGASWAATVRHSMLWKDTKATGLRFLYSMALMFPAVLVGLHMGLFPYFGAFLLRFVLFFDKIIALSLLPILFIAFGIDELSKIMLIVIGVTPTILLDTFNLTRAVPGEQVVKAFTLGASDFDVAYRVVLKQIWPRVLEQHSPESQVHHAISVRCEMIASTDGLAYRIALLRRHMGMDVIIPYVLWVALLLFLVDFSMRWINRKLHPWFHEA
jgi:NitT/TauT family transport system permease protein